MIKKSKLFILATLTVFCLLVFTGCGSNKSADAAGTYIGKYTKYVGDESKNEDEEFSLILNSDGTGTSKRDDSEYSVTWSIEGNEVTLTETFLGMTIDYNGTLEDNTLSLFNGDEEHSFTYQYVYEKQQ